MIDIVLFGSIVIKFASTNWNKILSCYTQPCSKIRNGAAYVTPRILVTCTHTPVTSSFSATDILLCTYFSFIIYLRSYLRARVTLHTHKSFKYRYNKIVLFIKFKNDKLDVHGSVHRNINVIERTNKMRPCSGIYYSNVS